MLCSDDCFCTGDSESGVNSSIDMAYIDKTEGAFAV
jgi:hypothetical protein